MPRPDAVCLQCKATPARVLESLQETRFCSPGCAREFSTPAPGKPATYQIGSDRYPYTIVAVSKTGAKLTVREDKLIRPGVFEPAKGEVEYAYRDAQGRYSLSGRGRLYVGEREHKWDPEF